MNTRSQVRVGERPARGDRLSRYNPILADGTSIENDALAPGMQLLLKDGAIATVTDVRLFYEPPDPPVRRSDGLYLSRVIGTIRHKGPMTVDVTWSGFTATSSPDHPYYSVSRRGYVPAQELQVGEFLLNDKDQVVPVQAVGKTKIGTTELYNLEVEYFHNYYVGQPDGGAVLVHNSAKGPYINTPAERQTLSRRLPESEGSWTSGTPGNGVWRSTDIRARQAVASRTGEALAAHVDIRFKSGYPVFTPHIETVHGVKGVAKITLDTDAMAGLRTRSDRDFASANRWLAEQLNGQGVVSPSGGAWTVTRVKAYLRDQGMQWHHHQDMTTMQLLRMDLHDNVAHLGGRSLKDFSFAPPLPVRKP